MSVVDELNRTDANPVWLYKIAGLEYRYHTPLPAGVSIPSANVDGTSGNIAYTDLPFVHSRPKLSWSLDHTAARFKVDPFSIELGTDGKYAKTGDPAVIFNRSGLRSAVEYAIPTETLARDTSVVAAWAIDSDLTSSTNIPGLWHVGQETMYVPSATTGPNTLTNVVRAAADTGAWRHYVRAAEGDVPVITDRIVDWVGRAVEVQVANLRGDNSLSAFVVFGHFDISEAPSITGHAVTMTLQSVEARLDEKFNNDGGAVSLMQGYHRFKPTGPHIFDHVQESPRGLYHSTVNGAPAGFDVPVQQYATHQNNFDITLGVGHPRRGDVKFDGGSPKTVTAYPAGPKLTVDTGVGAIAQGQEVNSIQTFERFESSMCPAGSAVVAEWPDDAFSTINTDWGFGTPTGTAGAFVDVRLEPYSDPPRVSLDSNLTGYHATPVVHFSGPFLAVFPEPWALGEKWDSGEAEGFDPNLRCTFPILWCDPAEPNPLSWTRRLVLNWDDNPTFPIFGLCPGGFYHRGEDEIQVDAEIDIPGADVPVAITYTTPTGETERTLARVTASSAITIAGPVTVGYALTLDARDVGNIPSFGDWGNGPPARVTPVVADRAQAPATTLLRVLLSGGDLSTAYDVYPFGARLRADQVDQGSVDALPTPQGVKWSLNIYDAKRTIFESIVPILQLGQRALGVRMNDAGNATMGLIPVGAESYAEAVATLTDDDMLLGDDAETTLDTRIINLVKCGLNYDENGENPALELVFRNFASVTQNATFQKLDIPLRGVELGDITGPNAQAVLRAMAGRIFQAFSYPRKQWTVPVDAGKAFLARPGAVFTVTSQYLRGFTDDYTASGVAAIPARCIAADVDFQTGGAVLTLQHTGVNVRGRNAGARMNTVPTSTTMTLLASSSGATTDPHTGASQNDYDWIVQGMDLRYFPPGDWDNSVALKVSSIAGGTVTFTAGHGIAPHGAVVSGGFLAPESYGAGDMDDYAYACDALGTLGGSNDPGHEIG